MSDIISSIRNLSYYLWNWYYGEAITSDNERVYFINSCHKCGRNLSDSTSCTYLGNNNICKDCDSSCSKNR